MIGGMLVLIATNETQGDHPGDHAGTVEGELVAPAAAGCGSPGRCGCGRGFPGLGSARSTTTAMVVDRPELSEDDVWRALAAWLEREGAHEELDDDAFSAIVDEHLACLRVIGESFAEGTVVSRWGTKVYARPAADAA